jgi:hypothetical protein
MPYPWPKIGGETVCAIHVRSTFTTKPIFNLLITPAHSNDKGFFMSESWSISELIL